MITLQELEKAETKAKHLREAYEIQNSGNPHVGRDENPVTEELRNYIGDDLMKNKQAAEQFAYAIETMLELRRQPGACAWSDYEQQWAIVREGGDVTAKDRFDNANGWILSGVFLSAGAAFAARDAVGCERIQKAGRILAGEWVEV